MTRLYIGTPGNLLVAEPESTEAAATHFPGSTIETVVIDPANPRRVYAGLYSGQVAGGQMIDPDSADGLRGVWRSDDAGQTWRNCTAGLPHTAITSLTVHGEPGGFGTLYAGSEPSTLSMSRDGGETWQAAGDLTTLPSASGWAFPPRPETHHVRWIELDPHDPSHLHLAIEAGAIVESRDGGATWHDRTASTPFDAHTLATHAQAPGRVYAAAGDGFMTPGSGYAESRDGGKTWTAMGDGLQHHYLFGLAVDSADPDTVLVSAAASALQAHLPAQAESYVYRRVGDAPWELATSGLPEPRGTTVPIIAAHPSQGGVFYAASNQGLFRSIDAGQTWEKTCLAWPANGQVRGVRSLAVAA